MPQINRSIVNGDLVSLKEKVYPNSLYGEVSFKPFKPIRPIVTLFLCQDKQLIWSSERKYTAKDQPMMYFGVRSSENTNWHTFLHEGKLYGLYHPVSYFDQKSMSSHNAYYAYSLEIIFDVVRSTYRR